MLNLKKSGLAVVAGAVAAPTVIYFMTKDGKGPSLPPVVAHHLLPAGIGAAAGVAASAMTGGLRGGLTGAMPDLLAGAVGGWLGYQGLVYFKTGKLALSPAGIRSHSHDDGNALCELCVIQERQAILGR